MKDDLDQLVAFSQEQINALKTGDLQSNFERRSEGRVRRIDNSVQWVGSDGKPQSGSKRIWATEE